MPRKKKPGEEPRDNQSLHKEEEDKQSVSQDAQKPISSEELQEIIKQLLQQQTPSIEGSTSQTVPQTQGSRLETRSQTKSGSSTPKMESSTPKTEPQTQRLIPSKPGRKTIESYAKKPPTQTWEEVLASKDKKTQALEYDRALAMSLIASSSQAITKQEYDSANAKFTLELAQKKPHQVTTPLLASSAVNPMDTPYVAKIEQVKPILQIEPKFFLETPNQVALKVFPSRFHFLPTNLQKTREYYELILVHYRSIELTRYTSKEDETLITHSTLQILKVLTPSQWGKDLSKPKLFDIKYEPEGYTS
ncbi:hypothetical protein K1719_004160 [Acacia pycnantha]|nr:hypothetical protein K1719_004160 [Acacia pycnantha]